MAEHYKRNKQPSRNYSFDTNKALNEEEDGYITSKPPSVQKNPTPYSNPPQQSIQPLLPYSNQPAAVSTSSFKVLVKYVEYQKSKGEGWSPLTAMLQERMIFAASGLVAKGANPSDLGFDFSSEVVIFVQKINLRAMEGGSTLPFEELINTITKAIDMLLYKPVSSIIHPPSRPLELLVLCFNNISSIYRQRKMLEQALRAVEQAVILEEMLRNNEGEEGIATSRKNIVSTYINKSVILSELGKHLESIETIKNALAGMEQYRVNFEASLAEDEAFQLKYLQVIAYFNLAVEHEHLFYNQYAKTFYETALNISKELNYSEMTNTIQTALAKIKANTQDK